MDSRKQLTPEQLADLSEKRRVRREQERRERDERVAQLTTAAYWRGYHDAMRDVSRALWRKRGLSDAAQDWFEVGYAVHDGHDALSIPYHNREWAVETVQYRLLDTDGQGKYRFEKGYPATAYWTRPATEDWPFIVCEGAIKGAVLFWRLVVENQWRVNVVSVTGKSPGRGEIERLADEIDQRPVLLLLDPDATTAEQARVGGHFYDVRYTALPGKVDDLMLDGTLTPGILQVYLDQATKEPL